MPEFIDPVFTKTSQKRSFLLNRKRAFWLVFAKTGSIISGTGEAYTVYATVVCAMSKHTQTNKVNGMKEFIINKKFDPGSQKNYYLYCRLDIKKI